MEYIRSLSDELEAEGCFLCRYWEQPEADADNHVISRGRESFVVMNRFPYTNGHLMVATARHEGGLASLPAEAFAEMTGMIRDAVAMLERVVKAQGFNVGFNVGACAGAGLPDHLHAHIVPRWSGDTNYMAVLGDVRVVPDSLDALYKELIVAAGN